MSKADRNRRESARERIAAQQAAARRAETRRRLLLAGGAVVVVIAVVVTLVLVKIGQGSGSSGGASEPLTGTALPASVTKNVTTVPASALNAVGTGSVLSYNPHAVTAISGAPLTSAGRPEMLYIGAEYCPYCAAMRWSMAVALSRFGTMSPAHGIRSASNDVNPDTATLTFYKSSYTSKYLEFNAVENQTRTRGVLLQKTTPQQQQLWEHYSPQGQTGYPFIDFGNKFLINGPIYDPGVLAGLNWQQISARLRNPSSPVAQGALGAANFITAAICKTTNGQPGNVCTAPGVTKAASHLGQ